MQKTSKKLIRTVHDLVHNRMSLCFSPDTPLLDIMKRMRHTDTPVGGVVNGKKKLIGMVSEREIVRKAFGNIDDLKTRLGDILSDYDKKELTAWDIMIANPQTLSPDLDIEKAAQIINEHNYYFMPVIDENGQFLAIADEKEINHHARVKQQHLLQVKDSLLGYMMGSEAYGRGTII